MFLDWKLDPNGWKKEQNQNNLNFFVCTRLTCLDHEQVIHGPTKMHIIPPQHFALIEDPVVRKGKADDNQEVGSGQVKLDKDGQGNRTRTANLRKCRILIF